MHILQTDFGANAYARYWPIASNGVGRLSGYSGLHHRTIIIP